MSILYRRDMTHGVYLVATTIYTLIAFPQEDVITLTKSQYRMERQQQDMKKNH